MDVPSIMVRIGPSEIEPPCLKINHIFHQQMLLFFIYGKFSDASKDLIRFSRPWFENDDMPIVFLYVFV